MSAKRRIVATYRYTDAAGKLLFEVVRFDPKDFRQRTPDGSWGLNGTGPVLYRLDRLAAANRDTLVFVVEGEKDVHALESLGLLATTSPMGAGKWKPSYNEYLRGFFVFILPDNDKPGLKHADDVARALAGFAESAIIVELPGLPPKGDVSDWLAMPGNDCEKLLELCEEARKRQRFASTPGPTPSANGHVPKAELGIILSTVQPQRVEWLWPGRIPLGKLTILDGDPGLGKSVLTLDLAARVSRGMPMPDGEPGEDREPAGVVLLSAEDGLEDTVVPRLEAAGADRSRILALDSVPDATGVGKRLPTLPLDVPHIKAAIQRMGAKLAVIDPLTAYLGPDVNSHRDSDVRRALFPLAQLADETGAAIVVVRHLNKATGGNPLYRGGGSIGIIGAARSGLLVAKDPDNTDRRILASTKCNLAKLPPSLIYALETTPNGALRIGWAGPSSHTAESLLAAPHDDEDRDALQDAVETLRAILANGPLLAEDVKKEAKRAGIAERTLHRAKTIAGVKSKKVAFSGPGVWKWFLPDQVP